MLNSGYPEDKWYPMAGGMVQIRRRFQLLFLRQGNHGLDPMSSEGLERNTFTESAQKLVEFQPLFPLAGGLQYAVINQIGDGRER